MGDRTHVSSGWAAWRRSLPMVLAMLAGGGAFLDGSAVAGPTDAPGVVVTALPDGRELVLPDTAASRNAVIVDPRSGTQTGLAAGLSIPRAGYTATLLPNGRVLILGGRDAAGNSVTEAEAFDPASGSFQPLGNLGVLPRTGHNAIMLTDGTLLLVGGTGERGEAVTAAERWDPRTGAVEIADRGALLDRSGASARLLPDGALLLVGGSSAAGKPVTTAIVYRPETARFAELSSGETLALARAADQTATLSVVASIPPPDDLNAEPDALVVLRFSRPVALASVNAGTVTLIGPGGVVNAHVVPSQDGMLAFISPDAALFPGTSYTLFVQGVADRTGARLDLVTLSFATRVLAQPAADTASAQAAAGATSSAGAASSAGEVGAGAGGQPAASSLVDDSDAGDEIFAVSERNFGGNWRTDRPLPRAIAKRINALLAEKGGLTNEQLTVRRRFPLSDIVREKGATGIQGMVLALNDRPLADVLVATQGISTRTDSAGRFRLIGLRAGRHELVVDGLQRPSSRKQYGRFVIGVDVDNGEVAEVPPVYLPRIRSTDWIAIPSPTAAELVLTDPRVPGLEIRIPKGVVLRQDDGSIATKVALVPLPLDRLPFAFPENAPVYMSLQPGGMMVQGLDPAAQGIRVIYPNLTHDKPGSVAYFWRYDPSEQGWHVYGRGHVGPDGRQILPEPGVQMYDSKGFLLSPGGGQAPPSLGPPPNPCLTAPGKDPGSEGRSAGSGAARGPDSAGDPVSCSTGLFLHERTDLELQDLVPIKLTRTYRPGDSTWRPFGIGASHPYEMNLYFPTPGSFQEVQLVQPDGGTVNFTRVSAGTGFADAVFEHTSSQSIYYKAQIRYLGNPTGWELKLRDGTWFQFGYENPVLIGFRDRFGNAVTVTRSGGNLVRLTAPSGRYVDFTYGAPNNRITQLQDIAGRVVTYQYYTSGPSYGLLWKVTDPEGNTEEYSYDTSGRMLTVKDRRGNLAVTNEYDGNGRVYRQTLADSGVYEFAYTTDGNGKITRTEVTDPLGYVERMDFNGDGYITARTQALGTALQQTISYEYQSGTNLLLASVDNLSRRTEYTYDTLGNVTSVTRLAGTGDAVTENMTWTSDFSQLASYRDGLNHETVFTYDVGGHLIRVQDPLNHATRFEYNAADQIVRVYDPRDQLTVFDYQIYDLAMVTDPLGRSTQLVTDVLGRNLAATDPLGNQSRFEYDQVSRLTKVTDAHGVQTAMTYDGNGNLLTVTDGQGGVTEFGYDAKNRQTSRQDPLLKTETFEYDKNDNLTKHTDRKSQVTQFSYDALDRRSVTTFHDASTLTYTWDGGNRLTQVVDSVAGTIGRSYDGLDRLTAETTPQGSVAYTYDAASRRASMTVTGQTAVGYTWDDANRLTQLTRGALSVALAYDEADRRTTLTLPNGVEVSYGYDNATQLTSITYKQGSTTLGDLTYSYDDAGRRTAVGGSYARSDLPAALASTTVDANNRLTNWGGVTLTYDDNGNLTGDGTNTYTWDVRNRLTGIGSGVSASFGYDALGRRTTRTVAGTAVKYLHDGLNVVQRQDGSGTPTAQMVMGGLDEIFGEVTGSGTTSYFTDALGSTIALTDGSGSTTAELTYEPYGKNGKTGTGDTPFRYTARDDDGTGLYYYRARYYHPGLGRFVTEDPIGLAGGINPYAYANGNPISLRDPLGLEGENPFMEVPSTVANASAATVVSDMRRQYEADAAAAYAHCIFDCVVDFLNPIPDVVYEKASEKSAERAWGKAAGKVVGKATGKVLKFKGIYDAMKDAKSCEDKKWPTWDEWWPYGEY
jgi:RHS repeat-associated protein